MAINIFQGYTPTSRESSADVKRIVQTAQKYAGQKTLSAPAPPPPPPGIFTRTANDISNFAVGAAKSVPQTLLSLLDMASKNSLYNAGAISPKVAAANTGNPGLKAQLDTVPAIKNVYTPKNPAESAGLVAGDVAQLFAPTGAEDTAANLLDHVAPSVAENAAKGSPAAKAVQLLIKAGARALDVGGKTFVQTESPGQAAVQGAVGAATVPLEVAAGPVSDLLQKYFPKGKALSAAEDAAKAATAARQEAAVKGVGALTDFNSGVDTATKGLGTDFGSAPTRIEAKAPDARLVLTRDQVQALNDLKQGKTFALPSYLDQETNPQLALSGSKFGDINLPPKLKAELNLAGKTGQVELTPTQAQQLLKELNGSTYKEVGGQLQVDSQRIGITKEIRDAAAKAFGRVTDESGNSIWNTAYTKYTRGITAVNALRDLVNQGGRYTPDQTLSELLKLGKTPENKLILKNAVDQVAKETGVDLSNPVSLMHQIIDSQSNLDEALSKLSAAQKDAAKSGGMMTYLKRQGSQLPGYLVRYLVAREIFKAVSSSTKK